MNAKNNASSTMVFAAIIVGLLILMSAAYVAQAQYYNSKELDSLVKGASEAGKSWSVTIHNDLTGRFTFEIH